MISRKSRERITVQAAGAQCVVAESRVRQIGTLAGHRQHMLKGGIGIASANILNIVGDAPSDVCPALLHCNAKEG